ncbi:hypothetical protein N5D79_13425 [Pseudomonas sp. GD03817]|uniref:phage tail assembly protein T n=1 Tax=Pseudomonas TaxID=286 RepID=UPI000C88C594|nr:MULTISPECIES: hypothetical protein [Pseudomonas]PNB53979.1 hypothetical protein C1X73_28835 [Pseudomonas sp. FW305-130]MCE0961661.1 hypothetical protein [Pseudomonas putida]MDD2119671.1 hypothetical protein [Pseudomonas putida]MDH1403853.1 hypothetical protein [Pseudomonas sp. GD03730]MDH1775882.1 hypothetical protein [Pseudomonas sp. GD03817]
MLNGVGGSTIAEAKATLSYAEVLAWVAYRDKHGSLSLSRRIELAAGVVALQVNRSGGGKADLYDFLPHHARPGSDLEQAMREWA